MRIPLDLVDFLESGVSILVGTRDAMRVPDAVRGVGALVSPDRSAVTVWMNELWAARALANVAENGQIAVGFARPVDHQAIQLKGVATCIVRSTEGADEGRRVVERYHASLGEQLYMTGIAKSVSRRLRLWPASAVTFEVRDMFVQSPGPDAGRRIEGT